MLFVLNPSTDAYFNLALEEYLLTRFSDDIFMLWRNENAVIVGINQNTLAEVNLDKLKEKNVRVVRRLTGGGTVFHDLGNVNFTFIMNDTEGFSDFGRFCAPIIEALKKHGVSAELSGRNDMTIDGKKFSGNAQCVKNGRILHHGTLLFSSNINDITEVLNVNPLKIQSKGIKSVSSRVTNISSHLPKPMSVEQFIKAVADHIAVTYPDIKPYELSDCDIEQVNRLVADKYSTWEWNYGSSPHYSFRKEAYLPGGHIEVNLQVDGGKITAAKIYGDFFGRRDIAEIEAALAGVKHSEEDIKAALSRFELSEYMANIGLGELIDCMF